ncbi:hypothetical protein L2E82_18918 [Cichorium intybus]|uniref:Uncharacterized protein n=1 Tax=Cichorium intybus TaxID=13427 RepID=A0ACB9FB21_CICIN|nr:hypothetical protein L2E82_18918 [Cichorium intybus]
MVLTVIRLPAKSVHLIGNQKKDVASAILVSSCPSSLYMIGYSGDIPEFPKWLPEDGKDFLFKCLKTGVKERWTFKELLNHPFVKFKS